MHIHLIFISVCHGWILHQYSYNFLFGIFQSLYKLVQAKQVNKPQVDKLCLNFEKFTFSSLPTQAAFISGNCVHLYEAYLHFFNVCKQYFFGNTACTKRFNFRKSSKGVQKSATQQEKWMCKSVCEVRVFQSRDDIFLQTIILSRFVCASVPGIEVYTGHQGDIPCSLTTQRRSEIISTLTEYGGPPTRSGPSIGNT
jgi:hypothetical protein